ncbi:hypothetical protein O6H91_04G008600 [Diphasiastrum complanatum]|uniref:Uncharacterized protein n=1 Tax=Diphasiastrum complanatum TaxID=34168 RepID=A0ACC2DU30_DIPCM|nr:hypothetical protein O6H91_04G008600 [Diphasiastrum complanatum]
MQACSSLAEPFGQRKTVKSIIAFHGIQSFTKRSRFLSWRRAYNFSTEHSSLCVKFSTQSFRIPIIKQACDHRCLASLNQGPQSDDNTPEAEKVLEASVSDSWKWTMTRDELVAYALLLVAVSTVPLLQGYQWSASFHFLFLAIWSVYVGSHRR